MPSSALLRRTTAGLRFRARDPRLAELHGSLFASADAARHMAHAVLAARDLAPGVAAGGAAASRLLRAVLRQDDATP